MKYPCIRAVAKSIGRDPTKTEVLDIENRIARHARQLARGDRQKLLSMTPDQRMAYVADLAAREYEAEVNLKAVRNVLSARALMSAKSVLDASPDQAVTRLRDMVTFNARGTQGLQSVESKTMAVSRTAFGRMLDALRQNNPKALGLFDNNDGALLFLKELHGEDSGSPEAKAAAKAFQEVAEQLRQRFNRAGGDVGKREDWALPHHHSQVKVAKAGREKWAEFVLPLLKRDRYFNDDGSPMTDAQVREFLTEAHATNASDGANKQTAGRGGSRANAGSESRSIHFKDADAWAAYWKEYGDQSMLDVLTSHIQSVSRNIALVESFGPNPDYNFRQLMDYALQKEKQVAAKTGGDTSAIDGKRSRIETEYKLAAGTMGGASNRALANIFRGIRSFNVATKLGSAYISSVTDYGTMWLTSGYNKIPFSKVIGWEMSLLDPANPVHREYARRQGLGIETMISAGSRFDAFNGPASGGVGASARFADSTSRLAQFVMRASMLNFATDMRRAGFTMAMMDRLGEVTRVPLENADADMVARLRGYGMTDADFSLWHAADVKDVRGKGDKVLSADAIYALDDAAVSRAVGRKVGGIEAQRLRDDAATRLMGIVQDESRMAIIEPGLRERALMYGQTNETSVSGMALRSFWQFKSFGVSMVMRHLQRAAALDNGTSAGRAAAMQYGIALVTSTTVLGAIALQLSQIAQGKDPRSMDDAKFWGASFAKGGAMGIYGDLLYGGQTSQGSDAASIFLGPTGSLLFEPITIAKNAAANARDGKPVDAGGDIVRFLKGNTPGASLWYMKAALDHMLWHDWMEAASPGYLSRMKSRARSQFGQDDWWTPGELTPDRAPDLWAAFGG